MATIASLQTEAEAVSLPPDGGMVQSPPPPTIEDIQREFSDGSIPHSSFRGASRVHRHRSRTDLPGDQPEQPNRLDENRAVSSQAYRSSEPMSSSPIVHVESVEDESQNTGAFVLVGTVDESSASSDGEQMAEPIHETAGETVAVQVDTGIDDVQDAVIANESSLYSSGVAMAAATLDDTAQEATVVASTPPETEWTEELDEKIAAAMGQSLGITVEREATVVGITEHDVHPADLPQGEVRATLIGEDYSRAVNVPGSPSLTASHREEATVLEIENDVAPPGMTRNEDLRVSSPVAEATIATTLPASSSPVAVATAEEEATVLGVEDDVHPAEFSPNEVEATLIENGNEVEATIIDRDTSCATTSRSPQRPSSLRSGQRAVSAPVAANTISNRFADDHGDTPAMSRDALAALDAAEDRAWLRAPPIVGSVILPPPSARSASAPSSPDRNEAVTSSCAAELNSQRTNTIAPDPPIAMPSQRPFRGRSNGSARDTSGNASDAPGARISSEGTAGSRGSHGGHGGHRGGPQRLHRFSNMALRSTKDVVDILIGEAGPRRRNGQSDSSSPAESIYSRTLLPWSVFHNEKTKMWIATVNTNQKALDSKNIAEASKALKAFSLPTRRAAEEIGMAMAPPRMLPFDSNPFCHICKSKFSVFRRACHCRNCGVCVCSSCSTARPAKMIPHTYNIKNESTVNICRSCDWLSSAFRTALLNGQQDEALALFSTGNVNAGSPFANVKGELLFPIHCAVMGGNLDLLKWLVDERCCPIRYVRSRERSKSKAVPLPLLTSKGRSLLGVALTDRKVVTEHKVDIIRYLVVDKGMSLFEEKDLHMTTALVALTAVLCQLPKDNAGAAQSQAEMDHVISTSIGDAFNGAELADGSGTNNRASESQFDDLPAFPDVDVREDGSTGVVDDCIICYDNPIDTVITPCGHQICCMQCSSNISNCPVCSVPCSFIRVYKA